LERFKVKEQINKALEEGLGKKIQLWVYLMLY
jgi:hypothetical protein